MRAADVMTTNVVTATASQSVQEVADLLLANRISAVPVVSEAGELLGIVSEGAFIRRAETGTERRGSWWLELLSAARTADDYVKANSRQASDVMTPGVVTVGPEAPLSEIADLMERKRIKRLPVVERGRLVGIVSRANLLQALASLRDKLGVAAARGDAEIRRDILRRIQAEAWKPRALNVIVHDGTVELWGFAASAMQKKAARIAAETTPGVKAVNDNIVMIPAYTMGA
jgi:CBS domain-containing protein